MNGNYGPSKSMKQEPQMPIINKSQKISHPVLFSRSCNAVKKMFLDLKQKFF